MLTLGPFATGRRWNATPFSGDANTDACREPAPNPSRIIRPAFVQRSTFCTESTWTVSTKLPSIVCEVNWNASAPFQMSAPLADTVYRMPS